MFASSSFETETRDRRSMSDVRRHLRCGSGRVRCADAGDASRGKKSRDAEGENRADDELFHDDRASWSCESHERASRRSLRPGLVAARVPFARERRSKRDRPIFKVRRASNADLVGLCGGVLGGSSRSDLAEHTACSTLESREFQRCSARFSAVRRLAAERSAARATDRLPRRSR